MNSRELHQRGLIDDRTALLIALAVEGWTDEDATEMLNRFAAKAVENTPRHWQRWTDEELVLLDKALADAGGKIPGIAITRPLAQKLGRAHKSVLSAMDRRLAKPRD